VTIECHISKKMYQSEKKCCHIPRRNVTIHISNKTWIWEHYEKKRKFWINLAVKSFQSKAKLKKINSKCEIKSGILEKLTKSSIITVKLPQNPYLKCCIPLKIHNGEIPYYYMARLNTNIRWIIVCPVRYAKKDNFQNIL